MIDLVIMIENKEKEWMTAFRPDLGPTHSHIQLVPWDLRLGVKTPEYEVNHLPP
jgi:hypothetical protein